MSKDLNHCFRFVQASSTPSIPFFTCQNHLVIS
ncbi:Protein of unknown function [Pyronema omphalodes CBS 100304]|uniref:Uncharacterized protein n=1 Tax=Pyronema omphalodes (strain CBS 100304) TaxID=1076935 RepID=U4LA86_PYROM|nr:Protein of unknown function [Pyronema omphalodes CBS 100304]